MQNRLIRVEPARDKTGDARSTFYAKVKDGLMPPPIRLGGERSRSVAWVEREIDAVIAARVAGKSDDEVRDLIRDLVAARREATTP